MEEIDKILENREKVLWEGAPQFRPFILSALVSPITFFGIFWMGFILFFFVVSQKAGGIFKYIIFFTPHFWIGLLILFGPPIYGFLVYNKTYYAVTNKRVIFQGGVIWRDFKSVDFDTITNREVRVGFYDKIAGNNSGSISIASAGSMTYARQGTITMVQRPYVLSHITNPYEVYKFFSKVSFDEKTDIDYPNKLRPEENPGYNTKYTPPQAPS